MEPTTGTFNNNNLAKPPIGICMGPGSIKQFTLLGIAGQQVQAMSPRGSRYEVQVFRSKERVEDDAWPAVVDAVNRGLDYKAGLIEADHRVVGIALDILPDNKN